jgi:hypothetical protein
MPSDFFDLLKAALVPKPRRQSAMPNSPHTATDAPAPRSAADSAPDAAGAGGLLKIVVNGRLRNSWRVQGNFKTGERVLSIPKVLADAPQEIRERLIRWAMLPMTRRARRAAARDKREMEEAIHAYIASCGVASGSASNIDPATYQHQTTGNAYDLQELFDDVNRAFFNGEIISYIRWGRRASRTSYHAVKIDKDGKPFNLITISGLYDSQEVPRFAIRGLIYHEMLHIAIPPKTVNGRRVIHGRDFKAAERKYPFYNQWIKWEKENMGRLLTNARRRAKSKSKR